MIDISNAFSTSSETVADFFQKPGLAFYIPLYQREYSWDKDNIDQLMEDISFGVEAMLSNPDEIRFMGTVIRVKESHRENVQPRDERALPTRIDNVIDGQQRISTIALLATLLYRRLYALRRKLPKDEKFGELKTDIKSKLVTIAELFSVDLRRGEPSRKPIIIRGSVDGWTFEGLDEDNYKSYVASYLAGFIRAIDEESRFPVLPSGHLVGRNLRRMNSWLETVEKAHDSSRDAGTDYPPAWRILSQADETDIWSYSRPDLKETILGGEEENTRERDLLCCLVQLLAFSHYLLYRCCFTAIDPISENWAFDMFQSLNATGTPLTAIETFKPMIVNIANTHDVGYKNSKSERYMNQVDELFRDETSAAKKSRLTAEYLTTFALASDGTKLARQFSQQRQWLTKSYRKCDTRSDREEYTRRMGELAHYLESVLNFDPEEFPTLPDLSGVSMKDKELATACVLYLHDAGHKMAHALLSRFYSLSMREKNNASANFVSASKAIAAFYTLWRSASNNSGLDNVYRQIMRGNQKAGISKMSWDGKQVNFNPNLLKTYLQNALKNRGLGNKREWFTSALQNYRYDRAKPICKFGLLVVAENTIADPAKPGLPTVGTAGSTPRYLTPEAWSSKNYRTIEHIAPQDPPDAAGWDVQLYDPDDYQRIGNLTLLPANVNISAGNRGWRAKWIYYRHLAEKDPTIVDDLKHQAKQNNIVLQDKTIRLLRNTSHKHHMIPIVELGINGKWNYDLVEDRTRRICNIIWDRMSAWLN